MTRVLIVDDNDANLYLLRALLQGSGYSVDEAHNGAEALARARRSPPDLIVSDLLMPVLDGYTLLRHWKADELLRRIPFVIYTATYTEPKDERLALALGADAFIIKPAEPELFMAHIRDVLAKQARGELPAASARPSEEAALLREYNEVLVHKLDQKILQLEQANRGLLEEIAERNRAEAALRASEERYRSLFHAITDPLFVFDRETLSYLAVNDSAMAEYGYSLDEFLTMSIRDLRPAEDSPPLPEALAQAGAGARYHGAWRHRKKDGTIIEVEISAHALDFAGRPACVIQAQDVTERKRLEEQLRQAQKMEAVGRLAGGVAHDFNNLLTIIFGHSELLLARPDISPATRESVAAIAEASERATALTRQLLSFSRRTLLQPNILDMNAVVAETGKMLRRLIGEDIQLTLVLDPTISRVRADPGQLDQVLMNLAVNARDAMPRGGRLTIETANVLLGEEYAATHIGCRPGPHVMLAVTDTGSGMTPEVMAHIFEPFFTTKEVGKGTGLGLAMVFGIVQQSGGCIHVYSEPGHGTAFKVYLPAVADQAAPVVAAGPAIGVRGSETILLVEDEPAVRRLATISLEMHGYRVLAAADGREALQIVETHAGPLDLILTDVVMPSISGPELAEALMGRFPHLKVLFMSGYTDDAVIRHGVLQADVSFIQKPFTPVGLAGKIRQLLDEGRRANDA